MRFNTTFPSRTSLSLALLLSACLLSVIVFLTDLNDGSPYNYWRQEGFVSRVGRGTGLAPGVARYVGCFEIETTPHSNTSLPYHLGALECLVHCHASSSKYASLGLGRQLTCLCLAEEMPGTVQRVRDSRCDLPCVSDPTFLCGGSDAYSIYFTGLDAGPPELNDPLNVTQVGCYNRTAEMTNADTFSFSTARLSPQLCVVVCNHSLFMYAGTYAGFICLCTNYLPSEDNMLTEDSCGEAPCSSASHVNSSCGGYGEVMLYRTNVSEDHASDRRSSLTLPSWLSPDLIKMTQHNELPMATEKLLYKGKERLSNRDGATVIVDESARVSRIWSLIPVAVIVGLFILIYVFKRKKPESDQVVINTVRMYPVIHAYENRKKGGKKGKDSEPAEGTGKGKKRAKKRTKSPGKDKKKSKNASDGEEGAEGGEEDTEAKKLHVKSKKRKKGKKSKKAAGDATTDKGVTEDETEDKEKAEDTRKGMKKKKKKAKTPASKEEKQAEESAEGKEMSKTPSDTKKKKAVPGAGAKTKKKGEAGDAKPKKKKEDAEDADNEKPTTGKVKKTSSKEENKQKASTEDKKQVDHKAEEETPAEDTENEGKEKEKEGKYKEKVEGETTEEKSDETPKEDNNSARRSRRSLKKYSFLEVNGNAKRDKRRKSSDKTSRKLSKEHR